MKILDKIQMLRDRSEEQIIAEIKIMLSLKHPNIGRLYTYFYDERRVYLVTEYCPDGDFYKIITKYKRLPESVAAKFTYQIASALDYMHSQHVFHRDLKPENILVGKGGNLKISDFGCSVQWTDDGRRSTIIGTEEYFPPEILEKKLYDYRIDIWTLGVMIYEMINGITPFYDDSRAQLEESIRKGEYVFTQYFVDEDGKDLIRNLLQIDPDKRLTLQQVLHHPFIVKHMRDPRTPFEILSTVPIPRKHSSHPVEEKKEEPVHAAPQQVAQPLINPAQMQSDSEPSQKVEQEEKSKDDHQKQLFLHQQFQVASQIQRQQLKHFTIPSSFGSSSFSVSSTPFTSYASPSNPSSSSSSSSKLPQFHSAVPMAMPVSSSNRMDIENEGYVEPNTSIGLRQKM
eukprot:MONOS_11926.1-p1 / transcript=MONOS_11926.1 / gene=MONOS_11926 / organism=Monocercomonoides_exilis_PA203 / gene_product=putative protein serine / transcript_product=putative protein serine / location=Mono_scaffold00626:10060-11426(-) / protein_length=398 / sequence_SO=supercontig / SO=protein_coding / is_pseudo=false